jgi:hypothetical protein
MLTGWTEDALLTRPSIEQQQQHSSSVPCVELELQARLFGPSFVPWSPIGRDELVFNDGDFAAILYAMDGEYPLLRE